MRFRRRVLPVIGLACAGFIAPAAQAQQHPGWGLPQLMQSLATVKTASAKFTERKSMKILVAPLIASGVLTYAAPGQMQKITTSPAPETFILNGQTISLTDAGDPQTHVFSLAQDPRIGGLVTGIVATLAGDLPALNRAYAMQLLGGQDSWQLLLQPKDPRVSQLIAWIRIDGAQNRVTAIDTQSANGDHSEMTIDETILSSR